MTKREKEIVRWAIQHLMEEEGDFHAAVGELCKLVGMTYPPYQERGRIRPTTIPELMEELKRR